MKKSLFSLAAAFVCVALNALPALADTGTLRGRVVDASTELYLEGARVSIEGTSIATSTDRGGRYLLRGVPAGQQTLLVNYLGVGSASQVVTVEADSELVVDVTLRGGEPIELEEYRVKGAGSAQELALNIQRSSAGLSTVVSSDAFGQFPDQNAAEALGRMPGVAIERDQGEGRFVSIRGLNPELNSVSIDGIQQAAPEAGSRAVLLDIVPTDTIERITVSKTPLASDPGDSIGGAIEIDTPSAFDREGMTARLSAQGNYSDLVEEWGFRLSGTWGNVWQLGEEQRLGLLITASHDERDFGSDNQEAGPWEMQTVPGVGDVYLSEEYEFREYNLTREREGFVANLEFENTDDIYFLRFNWNEFSDTEVRHLANIDMGDATISSGAPGEATYDDAILTREFKDRTETLSLWSLSAGGDNTFGNLSVDYTLAYSFADQDTPNDLETAYVLPNEDTSLRVFNLADPFHPRVAYAGSGDDPTDAAAYEFDGTVDEDQVVEEDHLSAVVNARYTFDDEPAGLRYIQGGLNLRWKEKDNDVEVFENGDDPAAVATLDQVMRPMGLNRDPFGTMFPYVNESFTGIYRNNVGDFNPERHPFDSTIEDYSAEEHITALYLMAEFGLGTRTTLIAGLRYEHTDYETTGFSAEDTDPLVATAQSAESDYDNFLPNLQLRYDLNERIIIRAAAFASIARPNFEQARISEEIDGSDITVGNPALDPYEAINLDLSIQYYLDNLGILYAGLFYKDVENFIYELTLPGASRLGGDLETFRNGDSGEIYGLEFGYEQRLSAFSEALEGFSVLANISFVESDASVPANDGNPARDVMFPRQSDTVGNLALTFERFGLFLRLAATYRSEYLDELGAEPFEDRYVDEYVQVDFSGSYDITDNWTVFVNLINLTDEPFRAYWGESGRLSQHEEYGLSGNIGARFSY